MTDEKLNEIRNRWTGASDAVIAYHRSLFDKQDVLDLLAEVDRLRAECQRLKWRLNHQTDDDVEACRQGLHEDCGAPPPKE